MRQHVLAAPQASPAPMPMEAAYAAAQARIQRHPAGVGYHGRYTPLTALFDLARHYATPAAVQAVTDAANAILAADDEAIGRMIAHNRPAPDMPNGIELAEARHAANITTIRQATEAAALANRPRVTLPEQLASLERRGIRISVEGSHIKLHAPHGVVTDGDRALLREHRAEVIAWLDTEAETI